MKMMFVMMFTAGFVFGGFSTLFAIHVCVDNQEIELRKQAYETLHRLPMSGFDSPAKWSK